MSDRLFPLAAVGLVAALAACAVSEPVAPATGTPGPTLAATPTAMAESTTSAAPTTADDGSLDLLYVSDSAGSGVAEKYAELAAAALQRQVRVHNHVVGGARITELRDLIRTSLAEEVAQAEIIVVYGNSAGFEPDVSPGFETCIAAGADPSQDWVPPAIPSVADWHAYRDVLDEIWNEIWALRAGQPTMLRTHDFWSPFIGPWKQAGIEPECTANWEILSQVIRETADANGVGFAAVFAAFNGPRHDEDPREKGWIGDDGAHASEAGMGAIAAALAAVGFDTSAPAGS